MKNKYLFVVILLTALLAVGMVIAYSGYREQIKTRGASAADSNASDADGIRSDDGEIGKESGTEPANDTLRVVTSFYPVYIAAENVIGDAGGVELTNMTGEQTGCLHDYQMTTEDMKKLADADVFLINGGGIESFLETVAKQYPKLRIIDTGAAFEDSMDNDAASYGADAEGREDSAHHDADEEDHDNHGDSEHHETEESGNEAHEHHDTEESSNEDSENHAGSEAHEGHEHAHSGENAHYWMDPEKYLIQIDAMAEGLAEADPARAETYRTNAAAYKSEVQELIAEEQKVRKKTEGQPAVIFHEAFEYLAESLGMEVAATLDLDEERQVSANELAGILDTIQEKHVPAVFAEARYGEDTGRIVEQETDTPVLYLDTLVRGSYDTDAYLNGMRENYRMISESVGRSS